MPDRWRLGSRNPFTVYRVADGAHDVDHAREHFVTSFRREEDARRAVDAVNGAPSVDEMAHVIDEAFDADFESRMSGGGSVSREDMARDAAERVTDLWPAQPTPPSCDCPDTDGAEPAGSAVGQRGAPTRDALVEAFKAAKVTSDVDEDGDRSWFTADDDEAERMADVALAALRDGGADTGGKDEERCPSKRSDSQCVMWRGHDGRHQNRGGWQWADSMVRPTDIAEPDDEDDEDDEQPGSWTELADEFKGTAEQAEEHSRGQERETGRPDLYSLGRSCGRSEAEARIRFMAGRLGSAADTRDTITRLARALGVSLDPDDPDPVGRLVEAAGKAREVEVVTSKQAVALPPGSWVLRCHQNGTPWLNASPRPADAIGSAGDPRWLVLYRAPAPAPAALAVGEVVESAADLDRRASVGTIVDDGLCVGRRKVTCWTVTGVESLASSADFAYPVTVVRVGTGGGES